jgi:hypothetical protein
MKSGFKNPTLDNTDLPFIPLLCAAIYTVRMELSKDKQETLDNILLDLQKVKDILAIVLGGSHAVGTATQGSDLDIGIYY